MWAVESLKICTLIGSICPKHVNIEMKKYRRVMPHDIDGWCKVWKKKITLGFKNCMRNLVNFNVRSGKSGKLQFDILLLPIAHKVLA